MLSIAPPCRRLLPAVPLRGRDGRRGPQVVLAVSIALHILLAAVLLRGGQSLSRPSSEAAPPVTLSFVDVEVAPATGPAQPDHAPTTPFSPAPSPQQPHSADPGPTPAIGSIAPAPRRPEKSVPQSRPRPSLPKARPSPLQPALPPAADSPPANTPAVPQASAVAPAAVSLAWRGAVSAWLRGHKTYPDEARQRGDEGKALVRFAIDREGQVLAYDLLRSTGSAALDQAVGRMLTGARLPAFPHGMDQASTTVTVQIDFSLEP